MRLWSSAPRPGHAIVSASRNPSCFREKWPELLPASFICECALPRRRGAGRRRRQLGRAAIEQWRDVADGDAPVDTARSVGLLLEVLLAIALRCQVLRRHAELLRQQGRGGFGAAVRQRQIVDVIADRVGVALDQEHHARVGLYRAVQAICDGLQLRRLIGRNLPRSGFEVDAVEVDAWHALAHACAVTDFVERIAPFDPLHRRRDHGFVDQFGRRGLGLDDIAIARNQEDRRRQIDIETADRARIAVAVVDDDDLAAALVATDSAQQLAVAAGDRDDLRAVGTDHDGAVFATDGLGLDVARTITEAVDFVVADEGLPARSADDNPAPLGDDRAAPLLDFPALAAEFIQPARLLPGCARGDRLGLPNRRG